MVKFASSSIIISEQRWMNEGKSDYSSKINRALLRGKKDENPISFVIITIPYVLIPVSKFYFSYSFLILVQPSVNCVFFFFLTATNVIVVYFIELATVRYCF